MKKYLVLGLALVAVFVYIGCGSKTNSVGPRNGRVGAANGVGGTTVTSAAPLPSQSAAAWGRVTPTSNQASIDFLSTDFVNGEVGSTVGCQTGAGLTGSAQPCAVEFTVSTNDTPNSTPITFTTGNLASILQSGGSVNPTSGFLTMIFWDSMTGTTDSSGTVLNPIPVVIPLSAQNSQVQGSSATVVLTFLDGSGTVQFQGNISGNAYQGNVRYQNTVNVNPGAAPTSGTLGSFAVNACSIMACQ